MFSEQVAHVVHPAARLPRYETENPAKQLENLMSQSASTPETPSIDKRLFTKRKKNSPTYEKDIIVTMT